MDSVSQIALGASLAHVALGRQLGRRALLLGAVLGTLPDLDVLVPYDDAVASFTFHRSWSHSLFMLSLASIPIAWLCQRLIRRPSISYARWWLATWLVLITHPLLDGFTVYGTQIWWPLDRQPTAWGSVFIIDPVYTVPLLFGLWFAWRRTWVQAQKYLLSGLMLSTLYLGWTLQAQAMARERVIDTVTAQGIDAQHIVLAPFPFSLLWRAVVVTEDTYLEGYRSLLDDSSHVEFVAYDNGKQTCAQWLTHWPVQRLDWFTRGAFALSVQTDQLVATDLRMGIEQDYVFAFAVATWQEQDWHTITSRQLPVDIDTARLSLLVQRVTDESIDLAPGTSALSDIGSIEPGPIRVSAASQCRPTLS